MKQSVLPRLTAIALLAVLNGVTNAGREVTAPGGIHVDAEFTGDLVGDGRMFLVEFYSRGPVASSGPGQPPQYVRGVRIRGVDARLPSGATWESTETTIPTFYPNLSKLWPVSESGGAVITTAVQYGGRVVALYAFRLRGETMKRVGAWEAQDFSIRRMGDGNRLVVIEWPSDYSKIPDLYAWSGADFTEAGLDFPEFFSKLAASYAQGIDNPQPLPPAAILQSCRLALQAYQLGRTPEIGRKGCARARQRIASGASIIRGFAQESPEEFENEKRKTVAEINKLISESRRNRSRAQQP